MRKIEVKMKDMMLVAEIGWKDIVEKLEKYYRKNMWEKSK